MSLNWTFIGQTITFIFFVWACWKFIWPPLINAMRERQQAIADGLSQAERAQKDLELWLRSGRPISFGKRKKKPQRCSSRPAGESRS